MAKNIKNVKLKDYYLCESKGKLYLGLTYTYEDTDGIHELYLPKMRLGIDINCLPQLEIQAGAIDPDAIANFGGKRYDLATTTFVVKNKFGEKLPINGRYANSLVKENEVEMTLDEIEKKLGHKIKIVNNKEE